LAPNASFRGIYLTKSNASGSGIITYLNYNLINQIGLTTFNDEEARTKAVVRGLYSASLFDLSSATQYVDHSSETFQKLVTKLGGPEAAGAQAAMDPWGNVRIPNINYLPEYRNDDPHKWIDTPWLTGVQNYASLIGDRVDGVNRDFIGNTTFTLTSSFQNLNVSLRLEKSWCNRF
jgi:hypothetical protein